MHHPSFFNSYSRILSISAFAALFSVNLLGGAVAPQMQFSAGVRTVSPGAIVEVPIVVTTSDMLASAQFTIRWDPAVLRLPSAFPNPSDNDPGSPTYKLGVVPVFGIGLPGVTSANFGLNSVSGSLTYSAEHVPAISIGAGHTIFSIRFTAIGALGTGTTVVFDDNPTPREAVFDVSGNLVVGTFVSVAGRVDIVPTTFTWTGADATNPTGWGIPGNWSPNGIPTAADSVIINSGTPQLDGHYSINGVAMSGGSLQGTGALTVSGLFAWTGGSMDGTGVVEIANGGTMQISGNSQKSGSGGWTLRNRGSTTWSGAGSFDGGLNGFNLENYGTFDIQNDETMNDGSTTTRSTFKNFAGATLIKSAGLSTDETRIRWDLENQGIVRNTSAGNLVFQSAEVEVGAGSAFTGSGATLFYLGSTILAGPFAAENLTLIQVGVSGTGVLSANGNLRVEDSSFNGPGMLTISPGSTVLIPSSKNLGLNDGYIIEILKDLSTVGVLTLILA